MIQSKGERAGNGVPKYKKKRKRNLLEAYQSSFQPWPRSLPLEARQSGGECTEVIVGAKGNCEGKNNKPPRSPSIFTSVPDPGPCLAWQAEAK